jgi:predicted GNAT family acetyltransferase
MGVVTSTTPEVDVRDVPDRSRYEAVVDGVVVGFADYYQAGGRVAFPHVEVDPRWQGQGIASALVRAALDDVIGRGRSIVAQCPFVGRHPEYDDQTGSA